MPSLNVVWTKRKRKDHQRMVGVGGIRKARNSILTSSSKHGTGKLMLSWMFRRPSLLSPPPPMIPFPGSLLRLSHHPQMSMHSFVFCGWNNSVRKKEEGVLKSNRNGRYWESSNQIQPPLLEENTNKFSFPPCSHSHCSQAISFFPLPGLQPTWYFPSKYIAFVSSIYPPNVNLASLEEMEGESKSLRNRRHQENMKPSRHIQCQTWNGDYAFLHVPIPSAIRNFSSFSWLTFYQF